jgi:DNA-binding transcriptional LysR family regulator
VRVNNGDATMPALIAGTGLGILPEFILHDARAAGQLEKVLPDWSVPPGAVYWVMSRGGPRPKRVEIFRISLFEKLFGRKSGAKAARIQPRAASRAT